MSGAASRRQHKKFCDTEGWNEVTNARGKAVGRHITYELPLADGRILRTRVSRPANNATYGPSLWLTIPREQLDVSEAQFWKCAQHGTKPARPTSTVPVPVQALPAGLVYQLIHTLGMSDADVGHLSTEEAVALMAKHWSAPST